MATDDFQLDLLLKNLSYLRLENMIDIPPASLEWILAQFILSLGQQLPLDQERPPADLRNKRISRFGRRYLPFSIAVDFPKVNDCQVYTLALATACGVLHARFLDVVVDDPYNASPGLYYAIPHIYFQFLRFLSLLFPANSVLWTEVDRLTRLTSMAGIAEKQRHVNHVAAYSWEEFQEISHNKMALAQINPFALALLNETPEKISIFQECWKVISLAVIVNDDILDWQEDYKQGNYTYLLTRILTTSPLIAGETKDELPTLSEMGVSLFTSNLVEELYLQILNELRRVYELASGRECIGLAGLINETTQWMQERLAEITHRKILQLFSPDPKL
jgi:hypothetical protein